MARLSRAEVIDPNEVAIAHVIKRTVRGCFLMGDDEFSGKNFDHRKVWIEELLQHFAAQFAIDLISYWILSNQRVAQRSNREENESGKFWQDRFRLIKLIDDESLLACMAYVDLNPVRAAMAETIQESDFTSIQRRVAYRLC